MREKYEIESVVHSSLFKKLVIAYKGRENLTLTL